MEPVTVGNFPDLATAEVAASLLEGAGIGCVIPDENFAGMSWQMGAALHGVRLQVASEDLEAARLLLEVHELTSIESPASDTEVPEAVCAACGSEAIGEPKWKNRLKAIALFLPVVLLAWPVLAAVNPRIECSSCGHGWR